MDNLVTQAGVIGTVFFIMSFSMGDCIDFTMPLIGKLITGAGVILLSAYFYWVFATEKGKE